MIDYSKWEVVLKLSYEEDSNSEENVHIPNELVNLNDFNDKYPILRLSTKDLWVKCVFIIQRDAAVFQYHFARLSTLGGANFLISQDRSGESSVKCIQNALMIAYEQELLGKTFNCTSLIIKAKVYQAVNWALLGYTKRSSKLFKICRSEAMKQSSSNNLIEFCESSENWLQINIITIKK